MRRFIAIVTAVSASLFVVGSARAQTSVDLDAWYGYLSTQTSSTVKFGQTATIGVGASADGVAAAGYQLELWAKPYERSWRLVDTATTAANGRATGTHVPRYNTIYEWRYTSGDSTVASNHVAVRVATKVTMTLADSSLRAGQTLVARGRTYPAKPGATVTLWRKFPTSKVKLSTARVRADGTYRVTRVISDRALTWTVYTTVQAWQGNALGTSPIRTADTG